MSEGRFGEAEGVVQDGDEAVHVLSGGLFLIVRRFEDVP
jgi:hypothetical protein